MNPSSPGGSGAQPQQLDRPWWGLGDVAAGIVISQFLSLLVFALVAGAAGWETSADAPIWAIALLQVPLWIGLGGTALWASERKGFGAVRDFAISSTLLDAPIGLAIGVGCQLLLLPLLYWPLLRLLDLTSDDLAEPARELSEQADGTFGWIVLAAMVVLVAPVVEELFYRGLVLRSLEKRLWPRWAVVVGSAALFAAMHFQPLQFAGLFVFGVVLALMVLVSGRLGPAIWAHAGFNATTVVVLYANR
ncbi:MAG: CPBP family intramembrane glutamic endopeptidase [Microthrixaceae bacterium]